MRLMLAQEPNRHLGKHPHIGEVLADQLREPEGRRASLEAPDSAPGGILRKADQGSSLDRTRRR